MTNNDKGNPKKEPVLQPPNQSEQENVVGDFLKSALAPVKDDGLLEF